jgi:hypothetical protein
MQICNEEFLNDSRLAELKSAVFYSPLIANPLMAMVSKKVC